MAVAVDPEVHRVERASALAQQRVALIAIAAMWAMFRSVNPTDAAGTYMSWYEQAFRISRASAYLLRRLATSTYRLTRALDTGSTVSFDGDLDAVELGRLRQEFVDAVEDALDLGGVGAPLPDDPDVDYFNEVVADMREEFASLAESLGDRATRSADVVRDLAGGDPLGEDSLRTATDLLDDLLEQILSDPSLDHSEVIEVDQDFSDLGERDRELFEEFFEDADREFEESIRKLYIEELENRVAEVVKNADQLRDLQAEIRDIADEAGLNAAEWLERLARNQGQILVDKAAAQDNQLLYAARKTGSNPCAFCAMLASRGYIYVGSTAGGTSNRRSRGGREQSSDLFNADGVRAYHPNCQCSVVHRWHEDAQADSVADWFSELWKEAGSLNEFRKLLDDIRREQGGSLNLYF